MIKNIKFEDSQTILKEMCSWVGMDEKHFEEFDFTNPNWYWEREWTKEDEDRFIEWLAKFLFEHKYIKKWAKYRGKSAAIHAAEDLVSNYGWKTK